MAINLEQYFQRINYQGPTDVSVTTLKAIHRAQVFSIPFENLAIHEIQNKKNLNDFIKLDEPSLFKKLVLEKRGGYCHENNELLALVLTQLGFKVDRLAARVLTGPDLPIGHKFLMVTIDDQKWIADVGFGGSGLFEPIPLVTDQEFIQYDDRFRLIKEDDYYIYQIFDRTKWKNLYEFDLKVFKPIDFKQMSYNVSHHPDSIFVTNRIAVMPRPEGRVILNNNNLKIITHGKEEIHTIKNESEYLEVLAKHFGIHLSKHTRFKKISTPTVLRIEVLPKTVVEKALVTKLSLEDLTALVRASKSMYGLFYNSLEASRVSTRQNETSTPTNGLAN